MTGQRDDPRSSASVQLLRWACVWLPFTWVTTHVVAVIWALMCAAGVLEFRQTRHGPPLDPRQQRALRNLCICAAVSAILIAVSVLAHHDGLRYLRQELKPLLLFLAVAAWSRGRRVDPSTARLIDASLMLGVVGAWIVALTVERINLPGNAVPWATTVSAAVCVLMPRALLGNASAGWRIAGVAASAFGLAAVVQSQTRAALWVLPWLALLLLAAAGTARRRWRLGLALLAGALAWGVWATHFNGTRHPRLVEAAHEVYRYYEHGDIDSSIGARLALWDLALRRLAEAPGAAILGHGSAMRLQTIREFAAGAPALLSDLTHFHSQYLVSLYDFGLAGLAAVLTSLLGMALAMRAGGPGSRVVRWQLGGLIWLQATGFATNANWMHGHYAFTVVVLVAICLLPRDPTPEHGDRGQSAHPIAARAQ